MLLGAAIASAQIVIKNSRAQFEVTTDQNGDYNIQLPAGTYSLRTQEMPGFAACKLAKIKIESGKIKNLNMTPVVSLKGAVCILRITASSEETKR